MTIFATGRTFIPDFPGGTPPGKPGFLKARHAARGKPGTETNDTMNVTKNAALFRSAKILLLVLSLAVQTARAQYDWLYVQCEDTCGHVHGIDLSHYQGNVLWEEVGRNMKINYVYLKATEGGTNVDDRYFQNILMARLNGLYAGSYHYFRPQTPVREQFENFTAVCLAGQQDLIPMVDVETRGGLTTDAFLDSLSVFLRLVEDYYRTKPLIYTGANFYDRYLSWGILDEYKLMIAQYTDYEPTLVDERSVTIWQYTGKGSVRGVGGNVDKSRLVGGHRLREIRYAGGGL